MNKLALIGLCLVGIAANGYMSSRVRRNEAIRQIDDHVAEAAARFDPSETNLPKNEFIMLALSWFVSHHELGMVVESHKEDFRRALHQAVNKASH